jgi:hypothetical protein
MGSCLRRSLLHGIPFILLKSSIRSGGEFLPARVRSIPNPEISRWNHKLNTYLFVVYCSDFTGKQGFCRRRSRGHFPSCITS